MINIEKTILTLSLEVDSDTDGNVSISQGSNEIKVTQTQALELKNFLQDMFLALEEEQIPEDEVPVEES